MQSQRRRLGSTELWVAPVGMGTCQLRLQPRERALATVRAACRAGINLFHTSPDYEGALEVTLEGIRDEPERPTVLHQTAPHLYHQALSSELSSGDTQLGEAC